MSKKKRSKAAADTPDAENGNGGAAESAGGLGLASETWRNDRRALSTIKAAYRRLTQNPNVGPKDIDNFVATVARQVG
jgi:hypothetical protein